MGVYSLGVPLLRRVGALRASLRSVLRTLRPSMHLTRLSESRIKLILGLAGFVGFGLGQ